MIRFQCPMCQSVLETPEELAGAVVRCSQCQGLLRTPAGRGFAAPSSPPDPPRPPRLPARCPAPETSSFLGASRHQVEAGRGAGAASSCSSPSSLRFSQAWASPSGSRRSGKYSVPMRPSGRAGQATAPTGTIRARIANSQRHGHPGKAKGDRDRPDLPVEEAVAISERVLAAINAQRRVEGQPELTLHAEHSQGCREHAAYLMQNAGRPDLDPHDQEPALPGATTAGRHAARSSSVVWRDPIEAVNAWLVRPAHRALLLNPGLASVGLGFARGEAGKRVIVADLLRGAPANRTPGDGAACAVLYPVHRQQDVPLAFPGNEVPDPLPLAKSKVAGFPITATFPPQTVVPAAQGWLEDESGKDVPVWFSTPTQPANERFVRTQQNTVCLFARKVLPPGMRYVVHVQATIDGADWSRVWSFTTASPAEVHRLRYEARPRASMSFARQRG